MAGAAPVSFCSWRRVLTEFFVTLCACFGFVATFLFVFDPFGAGPLARRESIALMDLNQRFMYPQVIRSGHFDAIVSGTSTIRLLDPEALNRALGGRFANLAMNASTAWEQMRTIDLFLRQTPHPAALIMGLDQLWCAPDATSPAKRVTFRAFPAAFYDDNPLNDWPELFSLKALEISLRLFMHRLGLQPERLRGDGYEVFTPDERTYDLARARTHLWGARAPRPPEDSAPYIPNAQERASWEFPALAWIDALLARVPPKTLMILAFMPNHVSGQNDPGSRELAREDACKAQIAAIAKRHGATLVDFRIASPITRDDANYWDSLHYRLPLASRIIEGLRLAVTNGQDDPGGFYRVLAWPGEHRGAHAGRSLNGDP